MVWPWRAEPGAERVVMKINVEGRRERERPKKKWLERSRARVADPE